MFIYLETKPRIARSYSVKNKEREPTQILTRNKTDFKRYSTHVLTYFSWFNKTIPPRWTQSTLNHQQDNKKKRIENKRINSLEKEIQNSQGIFAGYITFALTQQLNSNNNSQTHKTQRVEK